MRIVYIDNERNKKKTFSTYLRNDIYNESRLSWNRINDSCGTLYIYNSGGYNDRYFFVESVI